MAGLILANALLWQSEPHPAPLFRPLEHRSSKAPSTAAPPPRAVRSPAASSSAQPTPPQLAVVADIQRSLTALGLYRGEIDGVADERTREAIQLFEAMRGLPVKGKASEDTAKRLADAADAASPREAVYDDAVARVQGALSRAAYGPLAVDGVAGPNTRSAIRRFRRDHDLPAGEGIDRALLDRMVEIGALDPL